MYKSAALWSFVSSGEVEVSTLKVYVRACGSLTVPLRSLAVTMSHSDGILYSHIQVLKMLI